MSFCLSRCKVLSFGVRQLLAANQTKVKIQMQKTGKGHVQLFPLAQQIHFTKEVLSLIVSECTPYLVSNQMNFEVVRLATDHKLLCSDSGALQHQCKA